MVNLVINENMKIYRRWRTWIMVVLLIASVFLGCFVDWYYGARTAQEGAWRGDLEQQKQHLEMMLQESSQDTNRSLNVLEEQLLLAEYRLEHNIRPEYNTMWGGMNGAATLVMLITLFTVIVAGDSLAGEFSTGTIKLLLIRPSSRTKILISKYISLILFGLLLLLILFVSSFAFTGLLYQFQHWNLPLLSINDAGQVVEHSMVTNLWKTYFLNSVSTIMFVTMAFMISAAFRSSAMAIGFSIFALFAGMTFTQLVRTYAWSKYIMFANIDLTQYMNGYPFREEMTLGFSITVLLGYFIVFHLVAWLAFTRRDVAA